MSKGFGPRWAGRKRTNSTSTSRTTPNARMPSFSGMIRPIRMTQKLQRAHPKSSTTKKFILEARSKAFLTHFNMVWINARQTMELIWDRQD